MLSLHMFSNGMSILMCIKRLCGIFQYVMTKQEQLMVLVICINTDFQKSAFEIVNFLEGELLGLLPK